MSKIFSAAKLALQNLIHHPNTILFPSDKVPIPSTIRGAPKLEENKCTLCQRCSRVCPTGAITIEKRGKGEGSFIIDLGKCCYCQECQDICNFDAITLSNEVFTSELDREKLLTRYEITKEEH